MKTLFVLLIGAVLGVVAYVYYKEPHNRPVIEQTAENISDSAGKVRERIGQNITNLSTEDIKAELERTGKVIRTRAERAGEVIKDATADTRITTEIKGRYTMDRELSALRISVNTTDGIVTLAGSVSSAEEIQKAMRIALETEGVREVHSTLQVRAQRTQ